MTVPRSRLLALKEAYEAAGPPLDDRDGDWVSLRREEALAIIGMALRSVSEATVRMVAARQESGCNAYGIALSVCSDLREAAGALRRKP